MILLYKNGIKHTIKYTRTTTKTNARNTKKKYLKPKK
jgi:hypothetical protein